VKKSKKVVSRKAKKPAKKAAKKVAKKLKAPKVAPVEPKISDESALDLMGRDPRLDNDIDEQVETWEEYREDDEEDEDDPWSPHRYNFGEDEDDCEL